MQARMAATSAGSARSPSRFSTGSPGMRWTSRRTRRVTPRTATRLDSRRRRRKAPPTLPLQSGGHAELRVLALGLLQRRDRLGAERAGLAALVLVAAVGVLTAARHAPAALGVLGRAMGGPGADAGVGQIADAALVGGAVGLGRARVEAARAGLDGREEAHAHRVAGAGIEAIGGDVTALDGAVAARRCRVAEAI